MKRKEWWYAVIGGCIGATLTILVGSLSPPKLGEITCTGLRVVNAEEKTVIKLVGNEDGGVVSIFEVGRMGSLSELLKATQIKLECSRQSSGIMVGTTTSSPQVSLTANADEAAISVFGDADTGAGMDFDEYGGRVSVFGAEGKRFRAIMGVAENGNGVVTTWDKNGYQLT